MDYSNNARILIIEDHPLFATGIRELVEFVAADVTIDCVPSLAEGLRYLVAQAPNLIIADLRLPDLQGLGVLDALQQAAPQVPLLAMSGEDALLNTVDTLRYNRCWKLSKSDSFEQTSQVLLEALSRAGVTVQWRPNAVVNQRNSGMDHQRMRNQNSPGIHLTIKQQEVMQYLAAGMSNKEIARKLNLSPETIKTHLREIFTRMNVKNRTQAVSLYRKMPNLTDQVRGY
jgi:DNA-binding NarL/FixJ family response regulator